MDKSGEDDDDDDDGNDDHDESDDDDGDDGGDNLFPKATSIPCLECVVLELKLWLIAIYVLEVASQCHEVDAGEV